MFAKMDNEFLKHFSDRKDMLRTYRDIPIALQKLYSQPDYIRSRHGNDFLVTIDGNGGLTQVKAELALQAGQKRRKRLVAMVKDSYTAEEEQVFERLHQAFQELADEFGGKTIFEITDIFMKVSGDLEALRAFLSSEKD